MNALSLQKINHFTPAEHARTHASEHANGHATLENRLHGLLSSQAPVGYPTELHFGLGVPHPPERMTLLHYSQGDNPVSKQESCHMRTH